MQFLAISTDTHFVHKAWQNFELSKMVPGGLPFPMLSDAGGKIGRMYGVYVEEIGLDLRGHFLIDPEGVIQAMEVFNAPVGRNVNEMIRQVKAFQHVRATGEAVPAGWEPGMTTLKPGAELVGKVCEVWQPS